MMTHQMWMNSFAGIFEMFNFVWLLIYVFLGYCQFTLSKKLQVQYSWMAWIPVLSWINLLWIAGKSLKKYITLFILFILVIIASPFLAMAVNPVFGLLSAIGFLGLFGLSLSILDGVSRRTWHGFVWALGLLIFYIIMFPITALTYKPVVTSEPTPPSAS